MICSGESLRPEVKLISLKLYIHTDLRVLAALNVFMNTCVTFGDYSSCRLDQDNSHVSIVRILVFDLEEGESRQYGCTVTTVNSLGDAITADWTVGVQRRSEYVWTGQRKQSLLMAAIGGGIGSVG